MKLRPVESTDKTIQGFAHYCPGCDQRHVIYIQYPNHPIWSFDGNMERPTFNPSVLCYTTGTDGKRRTLCHYFLHAGKLKYCSDSPHKFAGQEIDLPDIK